jgi:Ca-activated chloride channel family protein
MTFLAPDTLWLLTVVVVGAAVPILAARRRAHLERRIASAGARPWVVPQRPGVRRGVVAAGACLFLVLVVLASARPARSVDIRRGVATVVIALDTSRSMGTDDVPPTRMKAARVAAQRFVEDLPPRLRVAYVEFAARAVVQVGATEDHDRVLAAIRAARRSPGTAIGEGIFKSLTAIARGAGIDEVNDHPAKRLPPSAIVLLSDGVRNTGRAEAAAAEAAEEAGVEVSTIAFGTPEGRFEGTPEPADEATLKVIAEQTGGRAYRAGTANELNLVYRDLASEFIAISDHRELTPWFIGAALVVGVVTALLSIFWFARAP